MRQCRRDSWRSAGPCTCDFAGCHRGCPGLKVHLREGARICWGITVPSIRSSDPFWGLLKFIGGQSCLSKRISFLKPSRAELRVDCIGVPVADWP